MIELCFEYLFVRCIRLYVAIMLRTSFRVNPLAIACLNVKEFLARSRQHIWPVWLIGEVVVYKLSGCGFESRCCQIFRYSGKL